MDVIIYTDRCLCIIFKSINNVKRLIFIVLCQFTQVMKTNKKEDILQKLILSFVNIDKKKLFNKINKKNKIEIIKYLENELFNLDEIKELISSLKYDKSEIINIIYDLMKLYISEDNEVYKKTKDLTNLASKNGFEWPNRKVCFEKVEEELLELKIALLKNDKNNIKEEIGDILFTLNSIAQLSKLDMLDCLDQANNKFEKRFKILKKYADLENIDIKFVSSEIKEKLWEKAKKN